jgi:hypothetical protein
MVLNALTTATITIENTASEVPQLQDPSPIRDDNGNTFAKLRNIAAQVTILAI